MLRGMSQSMQEAARTFVFDDAAQVLLRSVHLACTNAHPANMVHAHQANDDPRS